MAWFRPPRWPDGRRISVLDDRRATVLATVNLVATAAAIAIYGAARVFGTLGGWPTVAAAGIVTASAWWWSRRRLARVSGGGRVPRWPDGRHVSAGCDRTANAGYAIRGAAASVAVYATGAQTASVRLDDAVTWTLIPILVAGVAAAALLRRLRTVGVHKAVTASA